MEKLLDCDDAVGIDDVGLDPIALGNFLHLIVDSHDGLSLYICLRKGSFELLMS